MNCHTESNNQVVMRMLLQLSQEMAAIHKDIAVLKQLVLHQVNTTASVTQPKTKVAPGRKRLKKFSDADFQTAKFMLDTIRMNVPIKEPNLSTWANTIRLIRETKRSSDAEIRNAICSFAQDSFWSTTCLSPANLKKNFDRAIALKVQTKDGGESLDRYREEFAREQS